MRQYKLTALQSVLFFRIKESNGITGYDLTKELIGAGHKWSHQQIYRCLALMPLKCEIIPQNGKPDKKLYCLLPDIEYLHNPKLTTIGLIEEQALIEMAQLKRDYLVSKLSKETLPYVIERTKFDINYLENIIAKINKKEV